jgi:hypothetical protein
MLPLSRFRPEGRVIRTGLTLGLVVLFAGVSISSLRAGQQTPAPAPPSVWNGVFTVDQADRGSHQFELHCAECHGVNLEGGEGKPLRGQQFWNDFREKTVGELLSYIRTNMPFSEDGLLQGTLPTPTYVDIVAHILRANDLPAGQKELTVESSVGVLIIARDGPGELPPSTLAQVVGCLAPRQPDGSWLLTRGTRAVRASSGGAAAGIPAPATVPLGDREYPLQFVLTPLTRYVGHRVVVTGLLLGTGGINGLNVNTVQSVASTCN